MQGSCTELHALMCLCWGVFVGLREQVLRPFLLRREKAEVADELPSKQEEIVWCPLSGVQRILYRIVSFSGLGFGVRRLGFRITAGFRIHCLGLR